MDTMLPSEYERYLFHEGSLNKSYKLMGSQIVTENKTKGVRFNVWGPNAKEIKIVGDFNNWNGKHHNMHKISGSGIWTLFIPNLAKGDIYKYEIYTYWGEVFQKSDPYALYSELRPKSATVIYDLDNYSWEDSNWQKKKISYESIYNKPINIYEVHLGSWKRKKMETHITIVN
ncbi:Carbohydrate-binding module 48 (Isoamylase N-terminal domain) [Desulfonispora thiosulfatigenes DSM 11270]|uniref:Carbohydrate-binding module 48 (Isoamylase N-terminal domain) n=1 Tax=Desulfonispora thiosulfatigenes DSM 11270 TaxID=656914 RepID=A0A1W1VLM8_DESTI|nr:Carbohydrate-binding module 48 (Isoamylase N-terminal domain) [Desulfonispora thiosulfatigenes DSM 11270]